MAKYTENFNLIKPEDDEYYDVADFNENMDVIDAALTESAGISGVISADGQGVRVIKSIQWTTALHTGNSISHKNCALNPTVDPSRSIVLMQRLYNSGSFITNVNYVLTSDNLSVSFYPEGSGAAVNLGFWIIEFY